MDVNNYTTMDLANMILAEKTNKITPENIHYGIQIFDITGTYKGDTGPSYSPQRVQFTGIGTNNYNDSTRARIEYEGKNLDIFDAEHLDVSNATNLDYSFYYVRNINTLRGLSNWNTSNMISLDRAFNYLGQLTSVNELSNWDTSNVESMIYTFSYCYNLTDISGLSNWNISNVKTLYGTFQYCGNLVDLSPISNWDISNVIDLGVMFRYCNNLTNLSPINNWDTSNVQTMNNTFEECRSVIDFSGISNWNISAVTELRGTFANCHNLQILPTWNVSNVKNFYGTFHNCISLQDYNSFTGLFINSRFDNTCFRNTPNFEFTVNEIRDCTFLYGALPMSDNANYINNTVHFINCNFDTFNMLDKTFNISTLNFRGSNCNMYRWLGAYGSNNGYTYSTNLTHYTGQYNIDNCAAGQMFYYQRNLTDVQSIHFTNCNNTGSMFLECSNLLTINNLNIHFASRANIYLNYMFQGCRNLVDATAIDNWTFTDTSAYVRYINLYYMFGQCNNLSNESLYAITNFFINIAPNVNSQYMNLSNSNGYSPFISTNIELNTRLNVSQLNRLAMAGYTGFGEY